MSIAPQSTDALLADRLNLHPGIAGATLISMKSPIQKGIVL